jgi:hypothetical protein
LNNISNESAARAIVFLKAQDFHPPLHGRFNGFMFGNKCTFSSDGDVIDEQERKGGVLLIILNPQVQGKTAFASILVVTNRGAIIDYNYVLHKQTNTWIVM